MNSKKILLPLVMVSFLMMGLSMPSCPGQQAIQQQIDSIKAQDTELKMKLQVLDGQVKALKEDLEQTKALIAPMSMAAKDQVATIERLDASVKALESSVRGLNTKPQAPHAKPGARKKAKP